MPWQLGAILRLIAMHYSGGLFGVERLPPALSKPRDAIEDIIEPI